jgi:two-component system, OmpR family, sensor histidine kinase CiaH
MTQGPRVATTRPPPRFRHLPIRVAATTTAIVAVLYLAVAVIVVLLVQRNLVAGIDRRLQDEISAMQARSDAEELFANGAPAAAVNADATDEREGRRFEAPLLVWLIGPDGTVTASDPRATLALDQRRIATPVTASVGGSQVRLTGAPLGAGWIEAAQSTAEMTNAQNTVILAEVAIAPLVLILVFFGSLTIGRRVAGPIERARRRQLDFTADASHELRTPLTVIEAEASLALGSPREPELDRSVFEHVLAESRHLHRLVDDLLWLARFDATPDPPEAAPIDLGVLAATTTERFRAVCEQRGLDLTFRVTGASGPVVTAPPEWLARLVSVLLDNAVKYSPPGGVVSVQVSTDGGRVRLTVDDTGPGIPADERDRIFDRFHRANEDGGGAGLGLAIADAIVGASGGKWEIGDAPGGGARMSVAWNRTPGPAFEGRSLEQSAEADAPAPP